MVAGNTVLVTGAAGFIGSYVCRGLLDCGANVVGIDNLNDYYSVRLKNQRLERLCGAPGFTFQKMDLANRVGMERLFGDQHFPYVVHLGAQAGVRHSIDHPHDYVESNLVGFLNVLEGCRRGQAKHLIYASSSSVYGSSNKVPFSTADQVDHPVSFYAATKKANELMAHAYSHLYRLPCTGLRFFTVYGPWGRPDMAYFRFAEQIMSGEPINVFNHGNMSRDFTYIDDVATGILRVLEHAPTDDPSTGSAPYKLYNMGNHSPVSLMDMIDILESCLGKVAVKRFLPMQPGDVPSTYADVSDLVADIGFRPTTSLRDGLQRFSQWYLEYIDQQS